MTTNTPTDIPTLTPIEIDAAIASIEPGAPPSLQLAAQLELSPQELLDILARAHVAAFAEAARAFVHARADILARYTHTTALQNLAEIAQNRDADIQSRLRAAIAILHDARPPAQPPSKPARLSHNPTASPAPRFHLPPPAIRALPAGPPGPSDTATAAPPREPKPDQLTTDLPAPAEAPAAPPHAPSDRPADATPIAIHRAAGAPLARRDHRADPHRDTEHRCALGAASPPSAARPP